VPSRCCLRLLPLIAAAGWCGTYAARWGTIGAFRAWGVAGSVGLCVLLVIATCALVAPRGARWSARASELDEEAARSGGGRPPAAGYLGLLALLLVLASTASTLTLDLFDGVQRAIPERKSIDAGFSADLRAVGGPAGLVLLVLVVPRLLTRAGVFATLAVVPALGLLTSLALGLVPLPGRGHVLYWAALTLETAMPAVFAVTFRALFLPLSASTKVGPQVGIALLGAATGHGLGTLLGSLADEDVLGARAIAFLNGGVWALAMIAAFVASRAFSRRLR
jgi:hypothetical protein